MSSSSWQVSLAAVAVFCSFSLACVPTTVITTTTVCCVPLTISSLPKVAPVAPIASYQQCSVLRRISSTCPTTGYLICSAAPDTNPTQVAVQAISSSGTEITEVTSGFQATLRLYCVNGAWKTTPAGTGPTVTAVSCSQTGSAGRDIENQDAGK